MDSTIELLDAYKRKLGLQSDNAAALKLGVTRAAVSSWRTGTHHPSPAAIATMAEATGKKPAEWMMRITGETSKNPNDRKAWLRWATTVAIAAALPYIAEIANHWLPIV